MRTQVVDGHMGNGVAREAVHELGANVLNLTHLAAMSVSSVGPVFSIAAAMGPMIAIGLYGAPIGM